MVYKIYFDKAFFKIPTEDITQNLAALWPCEDYWLEQLHHPCSC